MQEQSENLTQRQNAFRVSLLMLGALIVYSLLVFYLAIQTRAWQLFAHAAGIIIFGLLTAGGAAVIQRGRSVLGVGSVLAGLYIGGLSATLTITDFGIIVGFIMIYLTLAVASLTLPPKPANRAIVIGIIIGLVNPFLELSAPLTYRLEMPALPIGALVISGILVLIYIGFIIRQFSHYSLRTKLIMAFVLISVISVGTVTFILNYFVQTQLTQAVGQNLKEAADSRAEAIGDLIATQINTLSTLAVRKVVIDKVKLNNESYSDIADIPAEIKRLDDQWRAAEAINNEGDPLVQSRLNSLLALELRGLRDLAPDHVEIFVTDQYGANVAATNRTSDYYQKDEAWWIAAYNDGRGAIYIGQPEFDESSNAYVIDMAIPLYDGPAEPVIGILRSSFRITALTSALAAARFGQTTDAAILLPDGKLLRSEGSIELIEPDTLAHLQALQDTVYDQFPYHGELRLVSQSPLTTRDPEKQQFITSLGWRLIADQDPADALVAVDTILQTGLLTGLGVVLFAGVVAVGLAQLLSNPITRLTTAATRIAAGDLEVPALVGSTDEIGRLAQTFNEMTSQLRDLVGSLEQRVADRTQRLKLVATLGERLSAILDFDQLLSELVNQVKESFDYYHVQVYIIDNTHQNLVMMAGAGEIGSKMKAEGHTIPLTAPGSLVARAVRSREVVTVDNVRQIEDWLLHSLLPDTYAEMAVPIVIEGEVVGVLDVLEKEIGGLDEGDADVLRSLANQVAIALTNARLFQETVRAKEEAETAKEEADTAREAAEATNRKLEERIWQTSGQAQLSDSMRGEQDASVLANNVMQQLCRYLGAQIGALYVVAEDSLKLMGGYAYGHHQPKVSFKLGEGLVGQAAAEKRALVVKEVPADYVRVRSSLGDSLPKQIMVFPVMHEEQVLGVIELGTLAEFTQVQAEFIEAALASIGIAFNTVQARTQIHQLLAETQRQAEALQSQGEKLQVANEELEEQTTSLRASEAKLKENQTELEAINTQLQQKAAALEESSLVLQEKQAVLDVQNRELKQAQQELEQRAEALALANKYKSEFLSNMSHELRTPLNSLLILARILTENADGNLTNEQVEFAQIIYGAGSDLLTLINDILDLAKVESGRLVFEFHPLTLSELVNHAQSQFNHVAAEKGLEFEISLDEQLPEIIETDEHRLKQILRNLLSNAFKFTSTGSIRLQIERPATTVVHPHSRLRPEEMIAISITDTGIGIRPEQQKIIFEAFQQGDGSASRQYGGTGLGLTISRELATRLGGWIGLESEPGKGSRFILYLPLERPTGLTVEMAASQLSEQMAASLDGLQPPHPTPEAAPDQFVVEMPQNEYQMIKQPANDDLFKGKKILVVDDDRRNAFALSKLLSDRGVEVKLAQNGQEALDLLAEGPIDLVLMDIMMPVMDGYETTRQIRTQETYHTLPILALTAKAMKGDREKCLAAGANDYLPKPIDVDQLFSMLQIWLNQ